MSLQPRRPTADEIEPMVRLFAGLMNQGIEEEDFAEWLSDVTPERSWTIEDGGRLVASSTAHAFDVVAPGGELLPMAGVTEIGVAPTHRRQGLLTQVMRNLFQDALDRGDALAGLYASDGQIYGRFGYGVASHFATQTLDAREVGTLPKV